MIINDNSQVAKALNTHGIHVGNNDISPVELRQQDFWKDKLIGYSIEYTEQLYNKHTQTSDYLGISPVFATATKTDTVTEWGLEGIVKSVLLPLNHWLPSETSHCKMHTT